MATIQSSIQLQDRMSGVLSNITQSMAYMLNTFEATQMATSAGFDAGAMESAKQEIAQASAELVLYREELERASNAKLLPPAQPVQQSWTPVSSAPVFMNSGAERFESEYQEASKAAQQLYRNQQAISAQAWNLKVVPPGMLNDVAATANRVQSLSIRIGQLNNIPVDLRTDQVNNDLETMRGKLSQAAAIQEQLSKAMGRMDVSAANTSYQQLNSILDSTEVSIRNNISGQERFNQSIKAGNTAASGLGGTIKRFAVAMLSVATAGKAIAIADQVTQTTARLDLMNQKFGESGNLQQKIYESAQRSRGAYQITADAVSKLGMQAQDAFANTDEIVAFAEQLNKTFVVAGTSAQGVDSVMLQLTQAMAAGKLQGEELNAVLDNAQPIVQNIADYMGVPVGQIKKLASEGAITAEVIKNAMFEAAAETDARFSQMPMTFGQVASSIKNQALMAFQPALQQLSGITQSEGFNALVSNITNGIQLLASGAVQALNLMGQAALWAQQNFSWLGPVIAGVTAAVLLFNIATGMQAFFAGTSAAAIFLQTLATQGLTAALLSCPLMWIAIAIGIVIAALVVWINRVGGIKVAWLTCVNFVLTWADKLKIAFFSLRYSIQNSIDNMTYGFESFKANVLNALGNLKVRGLMILQDFINGAIDRVNQLIGVVNGIAGTSIELVGHVEFATSAAIEEEAKQNQRAADLAALQSKNIDDKKARAQSQYWRNYEANQNRLARESGIAAAKAEADEKKSAKNAAKESAYIPAAPYDEIAGNTGNTAGNTAAMADSMGDLTDDLKYMRDAAEQEVINRFTLAELKIDLTNYNTLKTETDFDRMNGMLNEATGQILAVAAEGGGHL